MISQLFPLCLVTHFSSLPEASYLQFIEEAILGGVTSVQLRHKNFTTSEILSFAKKLLAQLRKKNIPLIINDNLELALLINADGVHLGQADLSPNEARKQLGSDKIIGWTVETREQIEIANHLESINYIGVGAIFPTTSKLNCQTLWGLEGLKDVVAVAKHPVIAIGGIHEKNVKDIMDCGVSGIAVISAIHNASEPQHAAAKLVGEVRKSHARTNP